MKTPGIRIGSRKGPESLELETSIQGKKKGKYEPQVSGWICVFTLAILLKNVHLCIRQQVPRLSFVCHSTSMLLHRLPLLAYWVLKDYDYSNAVIKTEKAHFSGT